MGYDVVVIGGGPAGSCAAALLKRQGLRPLLVESTTGPRHHIGESLLAVSVPLLRELGILPALQEAGFVRKAGALFLWGEATQPLVLPMPHPGYSFQVLRSRFDQMLLDHAAASGVEIWRGFVAQSIRRDANGRVCGVELSCGVERREVRCPYVVDASGLSRLMARSLRLPTLKDGPERAVFGSYYRGALRYEGPNSGDIITEASPDGWLWFIPLSPELTSVGFVTDEDLFQPAERALEDQIARSTLIRRLLEPAEQSAASRRYRYWSEIVSAPLYGPGYLLAGDAAFFVDPLFSTGVHAALYSASLAAATIHAILSGTVAEEDAGRWYDSRVREHYNRISETVRLLYALHPGESLFWHRRDLSSMTEEEAESMVVKLGAPGMQFFLATSMNGPLRLPAPVAAKAPEFVGRLQTRAADADEILYFAPGVEALNDWACKDGALVPAVTLCQRANRAPRVSYPAGSLHANLIGEVDGERTVSEIVERTCRTPSEHKQAFLFLGTLTGAGLLSAAGVPAAC